MDNMLRGTEAAAILGVSEFSIIKYANIGVIKKIKVKGRTYYDRNSVIELKKIRDTRDIISERNNIKFKRGELESLKKYNNSRLVPMTLKVNKHIKHSEGFTIKTPKNTTDNITKNADYKIAVYTRVSSSFQQQEMDEQVDMIMNYCALNGLDVVYKYSDIASGIDIDTRQDLCTLIKDVTNGMIQEVIVTHADRLARVGFDLISKLFENYGCKITVLSKSSSEKLDKQEAIDDAVGALKHYSIEMCDKCAVQQVKDILVDNILLAG